MIALRIIAAWFLVDIIFTALWARYYRGVA